MIKNSYAFLFTGYFYKRKGRKFRPFQTKSNIRFNLFLFLFPALVVDDCKSFFVDKGYTFALCDFNHLRESCFEEHSGDLCQFCACLVGKFDLRIDSRRRIFDGVDVPFLCLNLFGIRLFETRAPEVCAIALAIIDGHRRLIVS